MSISVGRVCSGQVGRASNRNFSEELLSYTDNLRICVMTRGDFPAHGFSWNKEDKRCLGIKNANVINTKDTKWESCIFTGKLMFKNKLHHQKYFDNLY